MYSSDPQHLTPAQQAAKDQTNEDDHRHGHFLATEHTNLPFDGFITRLTAEELPMLDSASRTRVMEIIKAYDGPVICSQEELPAEIRELMDL